jgi:hypothetical protein
MTIRTKNKDPKSTEFSPNDIVINTKDGVLFYKSDTGLFKVQGDNINTSVTESASTTSIPDGTISSSLQNLGNITGSNISASGDITANTLTLDGGTTQTIKGPVLGFDSAGQIRLDSAGSTITFSKNGVSAFVINPGNNSHDFTGNITASSPGHISASATSTGSFGRLECLTISASTGEFDDDSIKIGGESLNKSNLVNLKAGRPITTASANLLREGQAESDDTSTKFTKVEALIHENDDRTFLKFKSPARIATFVSGVLFQDLNNLNTNNYFKVGVGTTNLILSGSITGSIINGGSF